MISACEKANRQLMIAYRCQYEPFNRELIRLARSSEFGPIRLIEASNGQNQGRPDQWRQKRALAGGGSLPDIGIYCLNATRYITGQEPLQATAQVLTDTSDPRFKEVEDRISFQLRFPSGVLAVCQSFYSAHESRRCRVLAERGWIDLDPAFAYRGLRLKTSHAHGESEIAAEIKLTEKNHFALEMDHMAQRAARNERPHTPGEEGLQDLRLIEAIYRSPGKGGQSIYRSSPARTRPAGRLPLDQDQMRRVVRASWAFSPMPCAFNLAARQPRRSDLTTAQSLG